MRYDIARIIESVIYFIANISRRDVIYKTRKYKNIFAIIFLSHSRYLCKQGKNVSLF